jgi:putative peptidoglycan lipid II flippase
MSINKTLIHQVGLIVILTALAKIAAFAKDVLLSLQFGAGTQTDAYFIANAIPGFIFGGVLATIGLVFLPTFKRAAFKSEYEGSTTYRTAAIGYTVLSALLGVITFIGASSIVSMLAQEQPDTTRDLAVLMTRIMAFSFVFSGWVGLQNAVLQSHKLFIWPQIVQLVSHLFAIGGLAVAVMVDGAITLLVYAAVFGWIVLAPLVSLRAAKFWPKVRGQWFDKGTALSMAALSFPVFLSLTLDQSSILIGTYLGSFFPEGAISHLNYAQRLMLLLSSVFSLVIAYVLFPYLTESIVAKQIIQARRFMALALIAVLLLSAPLLVLSIVMNEALISFVFQRGAFHAEDAVATGRVMALFAPIIVLAGVREVLNRLFLAWQQTKVLLLFGILSLAVNLIASVYFSRSIGLEGIALGATCGALTYVVAQLLVILAWHKNLLHRDLLPWLTLIAVATAISAIASQWLDAQNLIENARLEFVFNALAVVLVFGTAIFMPVFSFSRLRDIFKTEQLT